MTLQGDVPENVVGIVAIITVFVLFPLTTDTMAVEIERISEGQRFVTKVLTERERAPAQLPGRDRASS